jgi:aminoglycoside/choline kinase family phosphotransferase
LDRKKLLQIWVKECIDEDFTMNDASSDASFRKYYRVKTSEKTLILMDAPPDKESISDYLKIGVEMVNQGINAPKVFYKNQKLGFILMEDFGDKTFLKEFSLKGLKDLYIRAIDNIINMQLLLKINNLEQYNQEKLYTEICLFNEWYLDKYKKINLSSKEIADLEIIFKKVISDNVTQNQYFVHRDYHSRNLMVLENNDLGILDFQDAVLGPMTYDLVSLLKDAYIELAEEDEIDLAINFWEKAVEKNLLQKGDFSDFFMQYELMGVQRHLKVLGIFSRLSIRDHKNNYLEDIPLVEKYLLKASERYQFLLPLKKILLRSMDA